MHKGDNLTRKTIFSLTEEPFDTGMFRIRLKKDDSIYFPLLCSLRKKTIWNPSHWLSVSLFKTIERKIPTDIKPQNKCLYLSMPIDTGENKRLKTTQ